MKLNKIIIDNFRNFDYVEINLNKQSLIFGCNDVGKSNLLRAIRLILDKSFSQIQYDADESDYCIFSEKEYIQISLEFIIDSGIDDEYIVSKYGQYIKMDKFYVVYYTEKKSNNISRFFIGPTNIINKMAEKPRSFITSIINCVYLDGTRDLQNYLKRSKQRIINDYKNIRTEEEISNDDELIESINTDIHTLNRNVERVSYIDKPTNILTEDLQGMSVYNESLKVKLTAINEFDDIVKNTDFITEINGKNIEISGDGRRNQLYISLWAREYSQNINNKKDLTIYIIEEPEAHLYFPLQSTTLKYLLNKTPNQMIVSSHSPKVILEFNPNSLVRIYKKGNNTLVANNGCSEELKDEIMLFSYRNNLISGEMFFSDGVFLVEGPSEEIFFKELCNQADINLDYYNIRIIPVNGIGFEPYARLLNRLDIPFSIRTDNDIYQKESTIYHSGLNRLIDIFNVPDKKLDKISYKIEEKTTALEENISKITNLLMDKGLYLANKDLENDIFKELCKIKFFDNDSRFPKETFVNWLQDKKATNMFIFMKSEINIGRLKDSKLILPIQYLIKKTASK